MFAAQRNAVSPWGESAIPMKLLRVLSVFAAKLHLMHVAASSSLMGASGADTLHDEASKHPKLERLRTVIPRSDWRRSPDCLGSCLNRHILINHSGCFAIPIASNRAASHAPWTRPHCRPLSSASQAGHATHSRVRRARMGGCLQVLRARTRKWTHRDRRPPNSGTSRLCPIYLPRTGSISSITSRCQLAGI